MGKQLTLLVTRTILQDLKILKFKKNLKRTMLLLWYKISKPALWYNFSTLHQILITSILLEKEIIL
jgi:hypothetical protein